MNIFPGLLPYTDTKGTGKIRIGKDCVPLTGTIRNKLSIETGEADFTAKTVGKVDTDYFSASAFEVLRNQARKERAPNDLFQLNETIEVNPV